MQGRATLSSEGRGGKVTSFFCSKVQMSPPSGRNTRTLYPLLSSMCRALLDGLWQDLIPGRGNTWRMAFSLWGSCRASYHGRCPDGPGGRFDKRDIELTYIEDNSSLAYKVSRRLCPSECNWVLGFCLRSASLRPQCKEERTSFILRQGDSTCSY